MYTDIASSSLRELEAVTLATNVTVFMDRGTKNGLDHQDSLSGSLLGLFERDPLPFDSGFQSVP